MCRMCTHIVSYRRAFPGTRFFVGCEVGDGDRNKRLQQQKYWWETKVHQGMTKNACCVLCEVVCDILYFPIDAICKPAWVTQKVEASSWWTFNMLLVNLFFALSVSMLLSEFSQETRQTQIPRYSICFAACRLVIARRRGRGFFVHNYNSS